MRLVPVDTLLPGKPWPLGAHWDGTGVNFAVFSAHAEKIELCLFDTQGRKELSRLPLPECTDEVWHGYLPDAEIGLVYGYRAYGAYEPLRGHRFNPNKLLLDPYAKQMIGSVRWSDALYAHRHHGSRADLGFDRRDSAVAMPKAVVADDSFHWNHDAPPAIPWSKTIVYETHVRGLTMRHNGIPPEIRGTFKALGNPHVIDHLQRLGITSVELLPVQAFLQDRFLVERGLRNYWGYSPLAYFIPEPAYLATGTLNELRSTVRRLHSAGIEVILDVVYNHTCEGGELGPTLSWKGLDNASYYRLNPGDERHYIDDTGCGNTLNLSHPRVLQMVLDSLRYWVTTFHIDGFRFDLATTLGREHDFDPGAGFFDAIAQDPLLSRVKLIAEPWDIGPGGYQVGKFPAPFAEWNDKFRDVTRKFWRGDPGQRAELAARLAGSADLFDHHRRRPWASINFVAAHDGFTLTDTVSYAERHNEANGDDNRDGHGGNFSANYGVEGESQDAGLLALRGRLQRAMLATVMFAQGTPMLLAGDEMMRSQRGNNNAYCHDSEVSWIDWQAASGQDAQMQISFIARLIAIRKAFPVLQANRFLHGDIKDEDGVADIEWFGVNGQTLSPDEWNQPECRLLTLRLNGPSNASETARPQADTVLILLNASVEDAEFLLPRPDRHWRLLIDSGSPARSSEAITRETLSVAARSVLMLANRDMQL